MPTHNEDVYTFNKAFGVFISDTLNLNLINEDKHLANLRYSLIEEEVSELKEAIENNDFTEIIDGLSDILYVAYGAGVSFGLNLDNDFTDYLNYMDIPISLETEQLIISSVISWTYCLLVYWFVKACSYGNTTSLMKGDLIII